jgi:hypothetical protein
VKILVILAGVLVLVPAAEAASNTKSSLRCYSPKETRERIARLKLANPLMLLRAAARRNKGQPLRSTLCRRGSVLVYRFLLLRPDGKVVRTYVNARTGKAGKTGKPARKNSPKRK